MRASGGRGAARGAADGAVGCDGLFDVHSGDGLVLVLVLVAVFVSVSVPVGSSMVSWWQPVVLRCW